MLEKVLNKKDYREYKFDIAERSQYFSLQKRMNEIEEIINE